ncbi:MAG: DUF2953 domain-containing protein [Clostridia bacterium]|nr:DUF2953 domain-containing protein [Clostridia bacterium]MDY5555754.1 DUF2953 domain-containing protein [Blautia sp.]
MLHILWMIIKFIMILLGILLGLVLLVILLILFCPVRYKISAEKSEDNYNQTEASFGVSWLFHGISLKAGIRNEDRWFSFHVLGISLNKLFGKKKKKQKKQEKRVEQPVSEKTHPQMEQSAKEPAPSAKILPPVPEKQNSFRRIRDKLHNMKKNLAHTLREAGWWKDFLTHPRVKAALSLVWENARFLIRHIFPTKIQGNVTFSCEDPSLTGMILAVLGMTIPFHKNCIQVHPLFNGENSIQGDVDLRGRVYGCIFVKAAFVIWFDKNVKYAMKRWKHKEG